MLHRYFCKICQQSLEGIVMVQDFENIEKTLWVSRHGIYKWIWKVLSECFRPRITRRGKV